MKFDIDRYCIRITPEDELDEAYIEEVLGLREGSASVKLVRENALGLSAIACLRTYTEEQEELSQEVV